MKMIDLGGDNRKGKGKGKGNGKGKGKTLRGVFHAMILIDFRHWLLDMPEEYNETYHADGPALFHTPPHVV
jgi:hypothetical protein